MTKARLILVATALAVPGLRANPVTALNVLTDANAGAIRVPVRLTYDGRFVVFAAERFNKVTDGCWKPEQQLAERALTFKYADTGKSVASLEQVLAASAKKPEVAVFLELKTTEFHDERDEDVFGTRAAYARELKRVLSAFRPDYTNVVALTRDQGILGALRTHVPGLAVGEISHYRAADDNFRRMKRFARQEWVQLPFEGTPIALVRKAHELGLKVAFDGINSEIAWKQAREIGADAVFTDKRFLLRFNRKPPARRADTVPEPARLLGFTKCLVDEQNITPDDISFDPDDPTPRKFYNGQWFGKAPERSAYTNRWGFLEMSQDALMISTPPVYGKKGLLPTLKAKDGFYIEFTLSFSNFFDGCPFAIWLTPTASRLRGAPDDPWFMTFTVDEMYYDMGLTGTARGYMGSPLDTYISNANSWRLDEIDRTKPVTYGFSYDPATRQACWWSDLESIGELRMSADSPVVGKVVDEDEYFWLITCPGPGGKYAKGLPKFNAQLHSVRVYVPENARPDDPPPAKTVYDLKARNPFKGTPVGAKAYKYFKCAFAATNDADAVAHMPAISGKNGFYVEATFPEGADRKAGFRLEPVNGGTWTMTAETHETDEGFVGRVRNRNAATGLDIANPGAERYCRVNRGKSVTYGISYDPEFDDIVWWRGAGMEHKATPPFVPHSASTCDYKVVFDAPPEIVRVYVPEAGDEPKYGPVAAIGEDLKDVPNGAAAYGFTKPVILDEHLTPDDVSMDPKNQDLSKKWFNGWWWEAKNPPPADRYSVTDGVLTMRSTSHIMSAPHKYGQKGAHPFLPGKDGFYIECTMEYSINGQNQGGFWLMPTAKLNGGPRPKDFHFMELDVDEVQFGPGLSATVHNLGFELSDFHLQNWNNVRPEALKRDVPVAYGAAYDPKSNTVSWWLNGVFQSMTRAPYVPQVLKQLEHFLLIQANACYKGQDYTCKIHSVKAYVPESSPLERVGTR